MSVSTVQDVGRPLITIAITCYNGEDTIQRAVESALNQTWRRREIVIVDDGSTDGSRTIVRKLERTHPELRVNAHEENSGFPSALNTVLSEARGVFVAFFDDDDASVPTRVVRQYQRIVGYEAKHPGATISCYSNRDVVEAGNQSPSMRLLGIGRVPVEPFGPQVRGLCTGSFTGETVVIVGEDSEAAHLWPGRRLCETSVPSMLGFVGAPSWTSPSARH